MKLVRRTVAREPRLLAELEQLRQTGTDLEPFIKGAEWRLAHGWIPPGEDLLEGAIRMGHIDIDQQVTWLPKIPLVYSIDFREQHVRLLGLLFPEA